MEALKTRNRQVPSTPSLIVHERPLPPQNELEGVIQGLCQTQPCLLPRYFYDERGSHLFDRITETPEYYHTRTERAIFEAHREEMMATAGATEVLVEPGSGTVRRPSRLLMATDPITMCRLRYPGIFWWRSVNG